MLQRKFIATQDAPVTLLY